MSALMCALDLTLAGLLAWAASLHFQILPTTIAGCRSIIHSPDPGILWTLGEAGTENGATDQEVMNRGMRDCTVATVVFGFDVVIMYVAATHTLPCHITAQR